VLDLSRNSGGWAAGTVQSTLVIVARQRIACLDHEAFDDPVKADAVIIALADKLDEVVAVKRGVIVQRDSDIAHAGFDNELYWHDLKIRVVEN
jgi:hypothetical protein